MHSGSTYAKVSTLLYQPYATRLVPREAQEVRSEVHVLRPSKLRWPYHASFRPARRSKKKRLVIHPQ